MAEFLTFTTESNPDPVAVTRKEINAMGGMPDDWIDYIWQEASDKAEAEANHDLRFDEYMAQQSGMTLEDYLNA